jgi:hypothetical protein
MNLFQKIDDVVWGETDDVWNETFAFLIQHVPSANVSEENVMKCISNRRIRGSIETFVSLSENHVPLPISIRLLQDH